MHPFLPFPFQPHDLHAREKRWPPDPLAGHLAVQQHHRRPPRRSPAPLPSAGRPPRHPHAPPVLGSSCRRLCLPQPGLPCRRPLAPFARAPTSAWPWPSPSTPVGPCPDPSAAGLVPAQRRRCLRPGHERRRRRRPPPSSRPCTATPRPEPAPPRPRPGPTPPLPRPSSVPPALEGNGEAGERREKERRKKNDFLAKDRWDEEPSVLGAVQHQRR